MPDESDKIVEAVLAHAATQFDPSQGWAAAQRENADFATLATRLKFNGAKSTRSSASRRKSVRRPLSVWLGYGVAAAIVAVFVGVGVQRVEQQRHAATSPAGEVYEARRGEQLTRQLPDGSRMILAPESRARFALRGNTRVVELEGQAFFEVQNSATRPFIVESEGLTTRVLGTSFVVRSYANDLATQVSVMTGTVGIAPDGKPEMVVVSGYMSRVSQGRVTTSPIETADGDVLSWLHGGLVFKAVPLEEVIVELERRFDVNIVIADSAMRMRQFTMEFSNPSLTEVLDVLVPAIGVRYEQQGRLITLRAR